MKIGVLFICLNPSYWPYAKDAIEGANTYLLPKHEKKFFLWTDMPDTTYGATVFPTESIEWPLGTLMRYHLFLKHEEELRTCDYLFYSDIDMKYVSEVTDEILGNGLTAALHPMYAVRREYQPPYEPNPESAAYIPLPRYYAGGFQGGRTDDFIKAMKSMKRNIDYDFEHNYMARWNDESHWNRYLYENPPAIELSPAYIYPDLNISDYYSKVWGRNFEPKIVALTKKFTMSKSGADHMASMLPTM